MKHFFLLSSILILLYSCKCSSRFKVPDDIIQPDSMAVLLTDVHKLQASLQLGYTRNDSVIPATMAFDDLWKKHHITENDYNRYISFYSRNPELLDSVYERVLNNLNQQKAELSGKVKK